MSEPPIYFAEQFSKSSSLQLRCQKKLESAKLVLYEYDTYTYDGGKKTKRENPRGGDRTRLHEFTVSGGPKGFSSVEAGEANDDRNKTLDKLDIPGVQYKASRLFRPMAGTVIDLTFQGTPKRVRMWIPLEAQAADMNDVWQLPNETRRSPRIGIGIKHGAHKKPSHSHNDPPPGATELEIGLEIDGEAMASLADVLVSSSTVGNWIPADKIEQFEKDLENLLAKISDEEQRGKLLRALYDLRHEPLREVTHPLDRAEILRALLAHLMDPSDNTIPDPLEVDAGLAHAERLLAKNKPGTYAKTVARLFTEEDIAFDASFVELLEGKEESEGWEKRDVVSRVYQARGLALLLEEHVEGVAKDYALLPKGQRRIEFTNWGVIYDQTTKRHRPSPDELIPLLRGTCKFPVIGGTCGETAQLTLYGGLYRTLAEVYGEKTAENWVRKNFLLLIGKWMLQEAAKQQFTGYKPGQIPWRYTGDVDVAGTFYCRSSTEDEYKEENDENQSALNVGNSHVLSPGCSNGHDMSYAKYKGIYPTPLYPGDGAWFGEDKDKYGAQRNVKWGAGMQVDLAKLTQTIEIVK